MQIYTENRKASFDYELLDSFEAGIVLYGFEVKSVKAGRMNLAGSFVVPKGEELWLLNADIPPYQTNNTPTGYDPKRSRQLLLKKDEIKELLGKIVSDKLTIIPTKVYNKSNLVKVEIALGRSKKKYDKRDTIKKREVKREISRTLKNRTRE